MSDFDEEQFSSAIQGAEIDPAAHQLATTYARALLGASENAGNTEEVLAEFDSLLRDVLSRYPRIDDILASGMIANEEKAELIARVFAGRVTPLFLHFLEVVTGHGRGRYLKAIHSAAHDLYDQLRGRVRVQVTTAVPLDEELAQRIAAQFAQRLVSRAQAGTPGRPGTGFRNCVAHRRYRLRRLRFHPVGADPISNDP